jgi:Spy/CpxP family protein refolding chaperone
MGNTNLKLLVVGVVLGVLVGIPSVAPAQEEGQSDNKAFREHLIKTLNLRPDKARIFINVEEKFDRIRHEALERINKSAAQLEKLLTGEKANEGKVKELTTAMAADQDILVNTYKGRRDETMAILTPVQQGEYLLATWKWQQKLLDKYGRQKTGPQDAPKKEKPQ